MADTTQEARAARMTIETAHLRQLLDGKPLAAPIAAKYRRAIAVANARAEFDAANPPAK